MKKFLFIFYIIGFCIIGFCIFSIYNDQNKSKLEIKKIIISNEIIHLNYGEVNKISFTTEPVRVKDKKIVWTSSDPNLVTVDNNGNISAVGNENGKAIITVTSSNGISDSIEVNVKSVEGIIEVKNIKIDKDSISLKYGEKVKLNTVIEPADATNKVLTWTSSDPNLVAVDSNGNISAKSNKNGKAIITVTTYNGKNDTIVVNVSSNMVDVNISLDTTKKTLSVGDSYKINVIFDQNNVDNISITWNSDNKNVATVDDGLVTAKWGGSSTITAKASNGKIAKATITVKNYNLILDNQILSTKGKNIVTKSGNKVVLRGYNLGVWLSRSFSLMQIQALATNKNEFNKLGYSCINNVAINQILTKRFGSAKANELSNILYNNFITENDIDIISQSGANVIRMPFEYSFFLNENLTYKNGKVDFKYLDWIIEQCRKRGIYVILDMHVGPGRQNSGGWCDGFTFFEDSTQGKKNRSMALDLWKKIASRYKNNPAVAGYDIINEPEASSSMLISFYDEAYKAIRSVDQNHIIFMEESCVFCGYSGVSNSTSVGSLPNPNTMKWKNVVYSTHDYFYNRDAEGTILNTDDNVLKSRIKQKTSNTLKKMNEYNIPYYIGEFSHLNQTSVWEYAMDLYDSNGLSYTPWTYKASWEPYFGLIFYGRKWVNGKQIPKIDILKDSYENIKKSFSYSSTNAMIFNNKFYNMFLNQFSGRLANQIVMMNKNVSLSVNESITVNYSVYPNNTINKKVSWTSSDPSVAIVDSSSGKVTAKKKGVATIKATLKPLLLDSPLVYSTYNVVVK